MSLRKTVVRLLEAGLRDGLQVTLPGQPDEWPVPDDPSFPVLTDRVAADALLGAGGATLWKVVKFMHADESTSWVLVSDDYLDWIEKAGLDKPLGTDDD